MRARLVLGKEFSGIYSRGSGGVPEFKLFSGGRWFTPKGRELVDVKSPIDGSVIARVPVAGEEEARLFIKNAQSAQGTIRGMPAIRRLGVMHRTSQLLEESAKDMVNAIVVNNGKTLEDAEGEVKATEHRLALTSEEARKIYGDYIPGDWAEENVGKYAIVIREPVGVVLAIAPFNYPLFITYTKAIPALLAGNSVIIKPAGADPIPALMMARLLEMAGIPTGSLSVITGRSVIGSFIAESPLVDMVTFTGSTQVGRELTRLSGIKKIHLELGGKGSAIVLDDADPEDVAPKLLAGSLKNAGQRCDAISRIFVQEGVAARLYAQLRSGIRAWKMGDPRLKATRVGPLINAQAAENVRGLVKDAVERGAKLACGGMARGNYFEPTLLLDVPIDARIMWEETFGPVVAVHRIASMDEAIEISNRSEYGLDSAVFTKNINNAWKLAKRLEVGEVTINNYPAHGVGFFPFGGVKESGLGREGIGYSIEEFTNIKTIVTDTRAAKTWE